MATNYWSSDIYHPV